MDDRTIARWRLHSLSLSAPRFASPAQVVEGLLGVQAENHHQACWAVATRVDGAVSAQDMAAAFDAGDLLRTHVLRTTWHYVRPDDILWLMDLTGPRISRLVQQLQRELGITDAQLDGSAEVIEAALSGGTALTRAQLGERLSDAGLPGEGRALGVLMAHAEMIALVCSGPLAGTDHTYALVAERAPAARRPDRDEALAELALRYFTGHGPATERDLAYWATQTLTDVRAGLAAVDDRLDSIDVGGRTYWYGRPPPRDDTPSPRAHLLQVLDEYHNGYQDSRDVLDAEGLRPAGRPPTVGMALVDGQIVGGMKRTLRSSDVLFEVPLLRDLARDEAAALEQAAARYGVHLGVAARMVAQRD